MTMFYTSKIRLSNCFSLILFSVVLLSSCSIVEPWTHTRSIDYNYNNDRQKGKALIVKGEHRGIFTKSFGVLCAEPSPDAISSFAAALSVNAQQGQQLSGEAALAIQNAVAYTGLRTQSIQLLRDALYRVCEGYFSKAINSANFVDLHERYQDNMIAILAIEQLTGTVLGGDATISGGSFAATKRLIEEKSYGNAVIVDSITEKTAAIKNNKLFLENQRVSITKNKKEAQELASSDDELQRELSKEILVLVQERENEANNLEKLILQQETELEELIAAKAQNDKELQAAKTMLIENKNGSPSTSASDLTNESSSSTGTLLASQSSPANTLTTINSETVQVLSNAVTKIVLETLKKPRLTDRCADILLGPPSDGKVTSYTAYSLPISADVRKMCIGLLNGD